MPVPLIAAPFVAPILAVDTPLAAQVDDAVIVLVVTDEVEILTVDDEVVP